MKSFRSSFHNLSHIGSSTASITPALMLADQCSKAFDQIAALLTDIRSISTPENVLVIEQGLESAIDSAIGTTLAETIRQHADNCSKNDKETIQSALSEAMTFINTCCEIAKKAQKKNKWDKDPQNKLEQNWFLFCREIIKVSKLLPLRQVDLQSIHSLCKDDSDVNSVLEGQGHLRSYHTIESRTGAHHRTSSASRSRSSDRTSSDTTSTVTGPSQATRSSTRKLQKYKSHSSLVSSPPAYSDIVKAKHDQTDDEIVDEVLPSVPASKPSPDGSSSGTIIPQGLFPSYPYNNHNLNVPLPQSAGFMGPMPPAIIVPMFQQPYLQPQYSQQPQWPYPPPSIGGAHKSGSTITESVTKFALDVIHPELKCHCHIRHFGDHPRCWRNCCMRMGCV